MAAEGADPRDALIENSARPLVARDRAGLPKAVVMAGIFIAAIILFLILDARRRELSAPATTARLADRRAGNEPSDLYVPPIAVPRPAAVVVPPPPLPPPVPQQPKIIRAPAPQPFRPARALPPPPRAPGDAVLVFDATTGEAGASAGATVATDTASAAGGARTSGSPVSGRSRASVLRNRATTVAQGTLIPAVLETALDSTRPGLARALVTRDVRGFDGSKVLIQRGSRLVGEYKADLEAGQNRALVIWNRLVRPDGSMIDLASPSADPLGRVGIKGQVNSHFLARFTNAFLQTALSVGGSAATGLTGSNNNVAILSLPGAATSAMTPLVGTQDFKRSLRVKQGASVSVFVARDLDFTSVEATK